MAVTWAERVEGQGMADRNGCRPGWRELMGRLRGGKRKLGGGERGLQLGDDGGEAVEGIRGNPLVVPEFGGGFLFVGTGKVVCPLADDHDELVVRLGVAGCARKCVDRMMPLREIHQGPSMQFLERAAMCG